MIFFYFFTFFVSSVNCCATAAGSTVSKYAISCLKIALKYSFFITLACLAAETIEKVEPIQEAIQQPMATQQNVSAKSVISL